MSSLPPLTPRQAEAAVERTWESLALTSGAGCGKTLVLARRFTELILAHGREGGSPFDRFVALTFTDKAALEMRSRVRAVLLEALSRSGSLRDRRRLSEWIAELPAAAISTIHSFCASLLRSHAVQARIDPAFEVCADELLVGQMQSEAVEEAVLAAVEAGDADVAELLVRADLGRVVWEVRWLLQHRIAWQAEQYADPEATLRRWHDQARRTRHKRLGDLAGDEGFRAELQALAEAPCTAPGDRLDAYRRERLAVVRRVLDDPDAVPAEDLQCLSESPGNLGSPAAWGGREALKQYRQRLKAFLEKVAEAARIETPGEKDAEAAGFLATLTRLACAAEDVYARAKRSAGLLDFDDLIVLTARLLREDAGVRRELRARLSQLLVDECQDTDAHQLQMLWHLLADGRRPPPGRLFIVGDPKQSIYRFRGAQAEVFEDLCRRFGSRRIPLEQTFRVHAAGAAFVNHVFTRLMPRYEPIISARSERPPGPSVEILLAEVDAGAGADEVVGAQADLVAQRAEEMIGREKLVWDRREGSWRPVRPGDIAVLFARMTRSLEFERAFEERELPYYVVAGTGFFRQQEVYDMLNLLRVVDNPLDDVALAGVLRSGLFGLDDNVLLHLAFVARPPYFPSLTSPALLERLDRARGEQVRFAAGLLGRLHRCKDALGPAGVVERALEETGYAAALLSQFNGRRKLGNVLRLVDAARSAAAGGLSVADFVKRYGEFVLEQSRYEQAPVVGADDDVIRIMTIHKAKGLEFPVVIIPDLNAPFRPFRGTEASLIFRRDWLLTYRPPSVEAPRKDKRDQPVSYRLARELEEQDLAEEDVRKLYVAATRHRDHLILVGADQRTREGTLRESGSHLARLDEVLGITRALKAGRETLEYDGGFEARVVRIAPSRPAGRRGPRPLGTRLAERAPNAADLAEALGKEAGPLDLPGVGPVPIEVAPAVPLAATALADFEHCPMLFRWRHELLVPEPRSEAPPAGGAPPAVDPATLGTFFHRCLELVDFSPGRADLAGQARAIVPRVLAEMELDAPPAGLTEELAEMLRKLGRDPLSERLSAARRRLREVALLYRLPEAAGAAGEVSGKIDLLYEDAEGRWHVVDYKSDRVDAEHAPAHAARYELQMMIYVAAAARHPGLGPTGGGRVVDATVYFLRAGCSCRFAPDEAALGRFHRRLAALVEELVRSRRSGRFARRRDGRCRRCPYVRLCLRAEPPREGA